MKTESRVKSSRCLYVSPLLTVPAAPPVPNQQWEPAVPPSEN
jgi:hypothetical protein